MLKFSGYPYLIRGQPVMGGFGGDGPPDLASGLSCHNALRRTAQPRTLGRAGEPAAPKTQRGWSGEMTLEQACPLEYQRAQCAFKDSMIH